MRDEFSDSISKYYKKFESLTEFKEREEFSEIRCFVIVNKSGRIIYANNSFLNTFKFREEENYLKINTEPDLLSVIENLSKSKFSSFHFRLAVPVEKSFFFAEIERMLIDNAEYFLLSLTGQDEKTKRGSKIINPPDTYNALDHIPVSITDSESIINCSNRSFETEDQLRKAYERESHINKLKSSFLANMSHEIRTPLNAIVGYSELIEDDVKSGNKESALELFTYLKEGYKRLINLVDNIMEMTLIQSGEAEIELNRTDTANVIKCVYEKIKNFAENKGITINIDTSGECLIIADENKLNKIIFELLDNAIKYNEHNGVVWIRSESANDFIRISVQDTGKGMNHDHLNRLLEPFTQEDEGYKREYEGAGLGLTLAYNLTKLMNGTFEVKSEKNKGTTIILKFKSALES